MLKASCNCDDFERTIKNIYVFANGEKYSGQKVVLSQNRWHHILNDITSKLNPYFGKVEKLYTTTSGLTVSSFTDLENNAVYVASNRVRRFSCVKGGYTVDTIPEQEYFEHYLTSQLQRVNKFKKLVYVRRDLLVIYIFRNGECAQSFKIVLTSDDLSSWSHILSYIALILDVPERCIKSLYSVKGNKICGPWELQHGASYVAVGYNQAFRKGCYRAEQKSTEVITSGFPVVPKDKNLICTHKGKRKMKPKFTWNHYDQFNCLDVSTVKKPKKCGYSSKKLERKCSHSNTDTEKTILKKAILKDTTSRDTTTKDTTTKDMTTKDMTTKDMTTKDTPSKTNKKVTVHMRIKNPCASNIMVTKSSGDSSPRQEKKWEEENSSYSNSTFSKNTNSGCCNCTTKSCSMSSKKNKHGSKYHSEPTSPGTSDNGLSFKQDKKKQTKRNLTWKHVKNESQSSLEDRNKVSVHIRGTQALITGGSSRNSRCSIGQKKEKNHSKRENNKQKETKINSTKSKRSKTSCEKNECVDTIYKIAKPTRSKHRSMPSKAKQNKDYLISCKQAAKCKKPEKWKTFFKNMSSLFFDSTSSIDSMKGRCCRPKKNSYDTDTEDSCSATRSSCSICRIQQERKKLIKKYK